MKRQRGHIQAGAFLMLVAAALLVIALIVTRWGLDLYGPALHDQITGGHR